MGLENTRNKKLLYHLTALDNMNSIIKYGLLSRADVKRLGFRFNDVADPNIISGREMLGLDTYVPFHFHPYSAFDFAVKLSRPNNKFVYITVMRELAERKGFKVLIRHPLSQNECTLYNYAEGVSLIEWDTLERTGTSDAYSKNVKMAECLSDHPVPASSIHCVYVPDDWTKGFVEQLFCDNGFSGHPPYVNVMEVFFNVRI